MSIKIDREQLRKDLGDLANNHGLVLSDGDLKDVYKKVRYIFENAPSRTIYVVSWTPKDVGGFDWFWDRLSAEQRQEALRDEDPTDHDIRLEEVEIPAVYTSDDSPEEITAWLEGFWYDR